MSSLDSGLNQQMISNLLRERAKEIAVADDIRQERRDEERQVVDALDTQARVDDIKVAQNFKNLDDKVKEKRFDLQMSKFLDALQKRVQEGRLPYNELNAISKLVARDVDISDNTKSKIDKVLSGLPLSKLPATSSQVRNLTKNVENILNNIFKVDRSALKDNFANYLVKNNLVDKPINQFKPTDLRSMAQELGVLDDVGDILRTTTGSFKKTLPNSAKNEFFDRVKMIITSGSNIDPSRRDRLMRARPAQQKTPEREELEKKGQERFTKKQIFFPEAKRKAELAQELATIEEQEQERDPLDQGKSGVTDQAELLDAFGTPSQRTPRSRSPAEQEALKTQLKSMGKDELFKLAEKNQVAVPAGFNVS